MPWVFALVIVVGVATWREKKKRRKKKKRIAEANMRERKRVIGFVRRRN